MGHSELSHNTEQLCQEQPQDSDSGQYGGWEDQDGQCCLGGIQYETPDNLHQVFHILTLEPFLYLMFQQDDSLLLGSRQ